MFVHTICLSAVALYIYIYCTYVSEESHTQILQCTLRSLSLHWISGPFHRLYNSTENSFMLYDVVASYNSKSWFSGSVSNFWDNVKRVHCLLDNTLQLAGEDHCGWNILQLTSLSLLQYWSRNTFLFVYLLCKSRCKVINDVDVPENVDSHWRLLKSVGPRWPAARYYYTQYIFSTKRCTCTLKGWVWLPNVLCLVTQSFHYIWLPHSNLQLHNSLATVNRPRSFCR